MKSNHNIILFSSGVSEESGLVAFVTADLQKRGFNCHCWRDLFRNSNDQNAEITSGPMSAPSWLRLRILLRVS